MVRMKRVKGGWGLFHSTSGARIKRGGRGVFHRTKRAAKADVARTRRRNR